ncbi:hypothetical protein [Clostridium sp. AM58-1XD]|uniref:hypothetical protein n=1 Tax=Clostridium sp. AM58-1XD TaxID=2292307 RepID=UPI000E54BFA9|nr:hypothetical protein [Clostridium sp. AM58-1XD]RGY97271.1 hypothetical protein DXA13_15130 [Clostridium sp. AM58-1XD]
MNRIKNTYSIYLKFGKKLKIPVNPQEINIKYPGQSNDYDVLGLGQIVVPGKPGLKEVSWESFFPGSDSDPYVNSGIESPESYIKRIEKAMRSKQVGRLIISRSKLYDTNIACIISNFETTDKGGEPEDIYYSIELREYRNYSPEVISIITTMPEDETGNQQTETASETERPVETPVLRVGAAVTANGKYWSSSYGDKPFGTANNLNTAVTRIVEGNPYPVCIGSYGWVTADQLQITG